MHTTLQAWLKAVTRENTAPTTNKPSLRRRVPAIAAILALSTASLPLSGPALAVSGSTRTTVTAKLYSRVHGHWKPASRIDSLKEMRGVFTVHDNRFTASGTTARMELRHLSWQGSRKVIMPPTVSVTMKRISTAGRAATFAATVRIPTLLPVYWAVVQFEAVAWHARAQAGAGVMIGARALRTSANTLTVAQAQHFCSARPRLSNLRYAVYLRGYFVGLPTRGDGPGSGIILDRPRHVTSQVLLKRTYPHGIKTGGISLPKSKTWVTQPGALDCSNGVADWFAVDI
jgi:hypothetical protein